MDPGTITNLFLIAVLIGLTAFFVGAEFAVVKVRMSRIEQLIADGNRKAITAKKLVQDLDYYLSACQLGITVTALGLGTIGEPTVEKLLHPLFETFSIPTAWATVISYALALSIMTFLHVVIGELAPKTLAIQFAEKVTLLIAKPLVLFGKALFPFIWFMNGSAQMLLRIFGVKPTNHEQAPSEEELKFIMQQSFQSGEINQNELSYVNNIFEFDQQMAQDVLIPRIHIVSIDKQMTPEEVLQIIDEGRYTRYPVTEDGDKDKLIGYVNAKELALQMAMKRSFTIEQFIHPLEIIQQSTPLQEALSRMQRKAVHIALVIDEYGGTAGMITMEDILEEIVGDIRDEFDTEEQALATNSTLARVSAVTAK
ncbi:hemolysin family protein [Paenibacillus yanchengensis]|uniref:Hemolysin family protein n=1 Tax=Paenibacillus yanchengensis TaxID=2035833 RepID=A0ABW4YN64_9BACL